MKRLFVLGLLLGFAGTLAAAHFVPWVDHVRFPSQTTVVANGGRAESFVIRLPADRIHALGPAAAPLRSRETPAAFAGSDQIPLLEHFKVRDSAGNVIGVAARHWATTPEGFATVWALTIPSRGSLLLRAAGEPASALEAALAGRGHRAGAEWSGELRLPLVADGAEARAVAGSGEFAGLDVQFTETWSITGVDDSGSIRGTIEVETVSRRTE